MDFYVFLICGILLLTCTAIRALLFWFERKKCAVAKTPYVRSKYIRGFFKNAWAYGGLVGRRAYLHVVLWQLQVLSFLALVLDLLTYSLIISPSNFYVFAVILLITFCVLISLQKFIFVSRRLNDAGFSCAWIFVPVVSFIICLLPSKEKNNKYCPQGMWYFEKTRKEIFDTIYMLEKEFVDTATASKIIKEKIKSLELVKDEQTALASHWKHKGYLLAKDYRELVYGTWD